MDLKNRARELINWHKTGILNGEHLRDYARELGEKLGNAFPMAQLLTMAENETKLDSLKALVSESEEVERLREENQRLKERVQSLELRLDKYSAVLQKVTSVVNLNKRKST